MYVEISVTFSSILRGCFINIYGKKTKILKLRIIKNPVYSYFFILRNTSNFLLVKHFRFSLPLQKKK